MTERDSERVPEADDLAVALPRPSGMGRPDETLCVLALGRESVRLVVCRRAGRSLLRATADERAGRERHSRIIFIVYFKCDAEMNMNANLEFADEL